MQQAKIFLAKAVPWPGPADAWWVNIHSTYSVNGRSGVGGRAFRDLNDAAGYIDWLLRGSPTDVYVCMSGQSQAIQKPNKRGFMTHRAVRRAEHAVAMRSLWLDVDVVTPLKPKGFLTTDAALDAFGQFLRKVGLPLPSYIVMSGSGGFHAHWVLEEAVDPATWSDLAHSLVNATKALGFEPLDTGVSIDASRLLRIPDTFNQKTQPPSRVWLAHQGDVYSLDRLKAPLATYSGLPVRSAVRAASATLLPGRSILGPGFPARPPIPATDPLRVRFAKDLSTGPVPTIEQVAFGCPWIARVLATAGLACREPEWRESLKVAHYVDKGDLVAHELSNGHTAYVMEDTDAKYQRVAEDHSQGRYGWPMCDTIWKAGAPECSSCPKRAQGKSPLHFAGGPPASPSSTVPITVAGKLPDLPDGYRHDPEKYVWRDEANPDDPNVPISIKCCSVPVYSFQPQQEKSGQGIFALNFKAELNEKLVKEVHLPYSEMSDLRQMVSYLLKQGLDVYSYAKPFRGLMASFTEELRSRRRTVVNSENFGWSTDDQGKPAAFVYGRMRWNCAGDTPAISTDHQLNVEYQPTGSFDVWKEATKLITEQGRPDLDMILAASFGAPLVYMTGHTGLVLSLFSPQSGVMKSTAMRIAQAVWSHPTKTMAGLKDTHNYVDKRLGTLRHLPFLYDELKVEDHMAKFAELIFSMGQGKSKGRLSRTAVAQPIDNYNTILIAASNNSLVDYIVEHTKTTTAGIYRLFEIQAALPLVPKGIVETGRAQALLGKLDSNFGNAGLVYAQYLGKNADNVAEKVVSTVSMIEQALDAKPDERFWVATVAVVLLGAEYAKKLELCNINTEALKHFLIREFLRMRRERGTSHVDITMDGNVVRYIAGYVNDRRQQTIITDRLWTLATRPPTGWQIRVLNGATHLQGRLCVHAAKDDKILRLSYADFTAWLRDKQGVQIGVMMRQIMAKLPARAVNSHIGLHTIHKQAREGLIEFDLDKLPEFFDFD